MAVNLRDAVVSDKATCVALLADLQAFAGGSSNTQVADSFEQLLSKQRGQIVIAEEDGQILGMVSSSYNVAMRYGGEYCVLEELFVLPEARGKNVGGLLVQQVISNAKARGCAEVALYLVEHTEHNLPFYQKYGFQAVGTELRQALK